MGEKKKVSLMKEKHEEFLETVLCLCLFSSEEAEALAKRLKLRFYRASVKEDLNVNEGENENLVWNKSNEFMH